MHTAYVVVLSINVGAGVLLLYLLGRIMRWRQPATILLGLGLFAFTPLYFVFQHAQPSLLLGVILASSFLFMERGAYKPSAVLLVFAGLKPQWLALPILVVAQRRRAALFWLAGAVVLVIIVPFVLVGEQGLRDYIKITLDRGGGDVTDIAFSSASLSWSGFLRALTGSPQPLLWGLMGLITLGTFILICLSGDSRTSAAAAILTTLLVVPHSHPQDWVVIAVAGAIALSRDGPRDIEYGHRAGADGHLRRRQRLAERVLPGLDRAARRVLDHAGRPLLCSSGSASSRWWNRASPRRPGHPPGASSGMRRPWRACGPGTLPGPRSPWAWSSALAPRWRWLRSPEATPSSPCP